MSAGSVLRAGVVVVLAACAAGPPLRGEQSAGAYRTGRGEFTVATEDAVWHDAQRGRDVPVRLYAPDRRHGAGPFPAVVFSHGGGESREAFSYLGERWASRGYIAVFLTHPGSDRAVVRARGMLALAQGGAYRQRPADVRFVTDRVLSATPGSSLLAGRVDTERVAVAGQCAGSSTAMAMVGLRVNLPGAGTSTDRRFRCVIALSPQPPGGGGPASSFGLDEGSWANIRVPALVVTGTRDFSWIPAVRANPRLTRSAFDGMPPGDKYLVEIQNAEHNAFTDSEPYYPARRRNPRHHGWVQDVTTAFLDAYLRNDAGARRWLLEERLEADTGGECLQESKPGARVSTAAPAPDERSPGGRGAADAVQRVDPITLRDPVRAKSLTARVMFPRTGARFPVILFSHCVGGSRDDFAALAAHWAASGYVVIQADHTDTGDLGSDWRERAQDLRFLLDSLDRIAQMAPGLAERMDASRVGASGHLIGAYAVCALVGMKVFTRGAEAAPETRRDGRVSAALLLSPQGVGQGLTERSWEEIEAPMLVAAGSRTGSRRMGQPPEWRTDPYRYAARGDKYLLWIDGLDNSYAGLARGGNPQEPQATWVRDVTTAFWDAHLKGIPEARRRLQAWCLAPQHRRAVRVEFKSPRAAEPRASGR